MKRVLVTGATGFIGRHLCEVLTSRGVEVVALARTKDVGGLAARVHRGDLTAPETVRGAAAGCDTIVHLAGLSHRMGAGRAPADEAYDRVNVAGATAIVNEARHSHVSRLIFLSSTSAAARQSAIALREDAAPHPQDAYGRSKLRAEAVIREAGTRGDLWTAMLRPPMVYGPGNRGNLPRLIRLVRRGVPLPLGAIRNRRSVLYIENLMHALTLLVERQPASGELFYVADAEPLSTPALIRSIGDAVGRPPVLLPVPVWVLETLGRIGDVTAAAVNLPFTSEEIMRLTGSLWVDDSKLRGIGYQPVVSTADGIRRMAAVRDAS